MKRYKHAKERTDRVGFYVALSVCLIAVGLAFWSAYTTLTDTSDASDNEYFSSLVSETSQPVAQEITGVTEPETVPDTEQQTESEGGKSIKLYESVTLPPTEAVNAESPSDTLSAVLRVTESLIYPIKSQSVLREYSEEALYNETMRDYRAHTGCDFSAEVGENVYAMCSGTIKNISVSELYGVIVEEECDGFSVYYCGLKPELSVEQGDFVTVGNTVGNVGSVPCESADKSHVHIEIKSGGKLIDPMTVIEKDD